LRREWKYAKLERRIDHSLVPIMDFHKITGVSLPEDVQIAILSHMGGWSKTSVFPNDMLSTIIHCADMISSRL